MFALPWYTIGMIACLFPVLLALYRLLLHPLRKFPGPKLAAISPWYGAYYDVVRSGSMSLRLESLHERYGPVVRIAPNELHFDSFQAFATIYGSGSKFTKSAEFYAAYDIAEGSVGIINPHEARSRRDLLAPFFSRRSVLLFETIVQEKVNELIEKMSRFEGSNTTVDLRRAFQSVTLDTIATYATGRGIKASDQPDFNSLILEGLDSLIQLGWLFRYLPFLLPMLQLFPKSLLPEHVAILIELRETIAQKVDEILADPSILDQDESQNVIYRHFLAAQPEKGLHKAPSRMALIQETSVLMTAGNETVSTICTVGAFHLLKNADVRARLMEELYEAWPDVSIPLKYPQLEKLPYLTAIIKESLRIGHGVTAPLRRVAPSDTIIAGYPVPKGTTVSVCQTFLHKNKDTFQDPDCFNPERWLQNDSATLEEHLVPFSKGPRMCLGINLAWCEMYIILANMFRKLDIVGDDHLNVVKNLTYSDYLVPVFHQRVTVNVAPRTH